MSAEIDDFRLRDMKSMMSVKSVRTVWPYFEQRIRDILGPAPTGQEVLALGDRLSEIFQSPPSKAARKAAQEAALLTESLGRAVDEETELVANSNVPWERSQEDVSAGGVAWECLVVWYLNLVAFGTEILAVRCKKANSPSTITDAITVQMGNSSTNTESDVLVYSVPDAAGMGHQLRIQDIDALIARDTTKASVGIIQCKTNWNDNSQIPMLWDLLYQLRVSPAVNVTIGTNGKNPQSFAGSAISYAFMTVPTNKRTNHEHNSISVLRVRNLSGGNYWGMRSKPNVAEGFSQYLNRNFGSHFSGSLQNHIDRQLNSDPSLIESFLQLTFESTSIRLPKPGRERSAERLGR